jgi:hypothetical protein
MRATIDLPMVGKLTREGRKRNSFGGYTYVLTLKFKQSKRHYTDEIIIAADKHQALKLARRLYPSASIK